MKFLNSVAVSCRYGDIAARIWEGWELVWEHSEADYQGFASFVAKHEDGRYVFYEWTYGSCSGCDGWEAAELTEEQIEDEMRQEAMWFRNSLEFMIWLEMLDETKSRFDMA